MSSALLIPAWSTPAGVRACFTTRHGGYSAAPYASFNLARHVGDDPRSVARNRALLRRLTGLRREPGWLHQVHGTHVHRLGKEADPLSADASITRESGLACVVMVADCVPILICDDDGREVAAVHAGWRGLAAGIIALTVAAFARQPGALRAWIGPCIGRDAYTVGDPVRDRFIAKDAAAADFFAARGNDWHLDLAGLARAQLEACGVVDVTTAARCVHRDGDDFFSYRRDGETGRMAALVWIG